MTAAHYLSLPKPTSGGYTPVQGTVNPFGSVGGTPQNLDAKVYFSASTYIPAPVGQSSIIPVMAQTLLQTFDWFIGIDPEGRATFGVQNFYSIPPATLLQDTNPASPVWNPWAMAVTSTAPIPTTNLSPNGLFLRVAVNCYGGSSGYPGANTAPCVVFFTSADEGTTFVQFGDAVPLPPRATPYPVGDLYDNNVLPAGPYVQLTVGADNNVFLGGIADFINGPVGPGIGVLPGMQVYGYSLQDSTGRYLLDYDFTTQPVTGPVIYGGAVLV